MDGVSWMGSTMNYKPLASRLKQLAKRCLQREFHMLLLVKFRSLVFKIHLTRNLKCRDCHFYL
uniref:Alternative protein UGDH n=1 Tax=Homo sapiens TaxID=9606 RepID=L8E902_HUMAN|nr:alternative protein UGDH [Homo sapiens]